MSRLLREAAFSAAVGFGIGATLGSLFVYWKRWLKTSGFTEDEETTFFQWLRAIFVVSDGQPRPLGEATGKLLPSIHANGLIGAIGNTPLIRIASLSEATGCNILAKAEFLNPGGSVKDRVALRILQEAFASGQLRPGGLVTEGSAGSTGIALALVCRSFGCRCFVAMPDDAAAEKAQAMRALGAQVELVRPVGITHPQHFVHVARRRAEAETAAEAAAEAAGARQSLSSSPLPAEPQKPAARDGEDGAAACAAPAVLATPEASNCQTPVEAGAQEPPASPSEAQQPKPCSPSSREERPAGFFADQFENLANFRAHYCGTGPEIWRQTEGEVNAFVAGAGTGGTIAGVSRYLKERRPSTQVFLADPPGSSLFNRVTRGVMYTQEEAEGRRLRNPFDTITEGVGINRVTANFLEAQIDGAFRVTDREAVEMSRFLLQSDGLFVGSSSAVNCVGAVRAARQLGPKHTIVTILCDSGFRHQSKFWNPEYLASLNLSPQAKGLDFLNED